MVDNVEGAKHVIKLAFLCREEMHLQ